MHDVAVEIPFKRLAIVNRGEAAMRALHAVSELNQEHGTDVRTIAFYTEPDRTSMYVRLADERYLLGPAFTTDAQGQRKSTYLDYARLKEALLATRTEAVWVGWGFVAEHAEFADLCVSLGITFIGPTGDAMRRLGDKIAAKRLAEASQVPIAAWSGGPVEDLKAAEGHAERLGYPLIIKATAGGGGRGIRKVNAAAELKAAFDSARSEAEKAFGDPTVYMEALVNRARHIEVQMLVDHHGTAWALGVRDCTVQRRNQKVIEEAPSTALPKEMEQLLRSSAVRLVQMVGYRNAGTVEFLYSPKRNAAYFMEVNARLQVEHPVTELTTGVDIVKMQLLIASGARLPVEPPATHGHAIEVRLNAEDPDSDFAPSPGQVMVFRQPIGPGIRVDTGVTEGSNIPGDFDSMIAKIIAYGSTRDEAISRMRRALMTCSVVIHGGATNRAFLLDVFRDPQFVLNQIDTAWLDRRPIPGARPHAAIGLLHAAIQIYEGGLASDKALFLSSAARGRPTVREALGTSLELGYNGQTYKIRVLRLGPREYRMEVDEQTIDLQIERLSTRETWIICNGVGFHAVSNVQGTNHVVEVNGVRHKITRDDAGTICAPAPALVWAILVRPGDLIAAGDTVAILEAMKTEMPLRASHGGRVRQVLATPKTQVAGGQPIIVLDANEQQEVQSSPRLSFTALATGATPDETAEVVCRRALLELKRYVCGFDVDPNELNELLSLALHRFSEVTTASAELGQLECDILRIFTDVTALYRRDPVARDQPTLSAAECFRNYLRAVSERGRDLPQEFVNILKQALKTYGIASLDPSDELVDALTCIHKARSRVAQDFRPLIRLLERPRRNDGAAKELRDLLDRVINTTHEDFPALNDLARHARFRHFDRDVVERLRRQSYDHMQEQYLRAGSSTDPKVRQELLDEIVACSQPLMGLIARWFAKANSAQAALLLQGYARRFYSSRTLANMHAHEEDGHAFLMAEYEFEGKTTELIATYVHVTDLSRVMNTVNAVLGKVATDRECVLDLVLALDTNDVKVETLEADLHALVGKMAWSRPMARICFTLVTPESEARTAHITYAFAPTGPYEIRYYRGIHPMMAGRLELWRLRQFDIERLPSPEDVYLFRGVARDNKKDERLFAFVNVRDLEDRKNGEVLPTLDHMYMEAVAAIRDYQKLHPHKVLQWNRITLHVWPTVDLHSTDIGKMIDRLAPASKHLGLEKVVVRLRRQDEKGVVAERALHIALEGGRMTRVHESAPSPKPVKTLTPYAHRVMSLRTRGLSYPYEVVRMLAPQPNEGKMLFPPGTFQEYDLDAQGRLVLTEREPGNNTANLVVGLITNFVPRFEKDGMSRVIILSDPSRDMGALAEPECVRIIAAIDLAKRMNIPVEWFPVSAGAKIAFDSGTENLDWTARVLRRIIEFTEAGGEINVIVAGVNVGAQSYWNAEATMLMHTRGILVMTPGASMVLTGKQALEYSGSVAAEDNQGIGGLDRIMGPNGQAQYAARDLSDACQILLHHYELTYVAPGERFPRRATTRDAATRDVTTYPYPALRGESFTTIGDVFSVEKNGERKKPFDIRTVMQAFVDQDRAPLERWSMMREADSAVVWDAFVGGIASSVLGIESRNLTRLGPVAGDGPTTFSAGTLFPLSSKKIARALNAASGRRPVVVLANLSGFDGSPESLRKLQLEYGAEIGRAVVNFKGPLVFCVISRYHGGAYVVFSRFLNSNIEAAALDGAYASVIGGAPAAAVVFAREVRAQTHTDPRVSELMAALEDADDDRKAELTARYNEVLRVVQAEKQSEFAQRFDQIHSAKRALEVGSLDNIIQPRELRSYIIGALERGLKRE